MALGVLYNAARITLAESAHKLASLRVLGFRRSEVAAILLGELALVETHRADLRNGVDARGDVLDQLVAEGILKLLLNLQRKLQVSYLFITHDLATVKAISDEIVVMLNGRIVEKGSKKDILKPPHHEYTDLLLSSVPKMDPEWLDNLLKTRAGHRNTAHL